MWRIHRRNRPSRIAGRARLIESSEVLSSVTPLVGGNGTGSVQAPTGALHPVGAISLAAVVGDSIPIDTKNYARLLLRQGFFQQLGTELRRTALRRIDTFSRHLLPNKVILTALLSYR